MTRKPRYCISCKRDRPGAEFIHGGKTCIGCRKARKTRRGPKPQDERDIHAFDVIRLTVAECPECCRIMFAPPGKTATCDHRIWEPVEVKGIAG